MAQCEKINLTKMITVNGSLIFRLIWEINFPKNYSFYGKITPFKKN